MQSIGNEFDADLHEAITSIPAPTDDMKGKVIDEMEKGYELNDALSLCQSNCRSVTSYWIWDVNLGFC
jgi:hypothetical protein